MTNDEKRALSFLLALIFLSAALRLARLPDPITLPDSATLDLAAHVDATRAAVAEEERLDRPLAEGERLDPNSASSPELQRLPGVGQALAERIIEDRDRNGRYRTLADLDRVSGVGPRMLERLAPHLQLRSGPATVTPTGPRPLPRRSAGRTAGRVSAEHAGVAGVAGSAGSGSGKPVERLDLNAADAAELAGLPGIGPVLAERVVAYRDSVGHFASLEELTRVSGIGPATLERLRSRLRVR